MDSLKSVFNLFAVGGNRRGVPLITEIRCILSFIFCSKESSSLVMDNLLD